MHDRSQHFRETENRLYDSAQDTFAQDDNYRFCQRHQDFVDYGVIDSSKAEGFEGDSIKIKAPQNAERRVAIKTPIFI